MAVILITHDLGVIAETVQRVCVMLIGKCLTRFWTSSSVSPNSRRGLFMDALLGGHRSSSPKLAIVFVVGSHAIINVPPHLGTTREVRYCPAPDPVFRRNLHPRRFFLPADLRAVLKPRAELAAARQVRQGRHHTGNFLEPYLFATWERAQEALRVRVLGTGVGGSRRVH